MLNLNKLTELNNNKLKLVKACLGQSVASCICFNFQLSSFSEKYVTKKILTKSHLQCCCKIQTHKTGFPQKKYLVFHSDVILFQHPSLTFIIDQFLRICLGIYSCPLLCRKKISHFKTYIPQPSKGTVVTIGYNVPRLRKTK